MKNVIYQILLSFFLFVSQFLTIWPRCGIL